MKANIVEIMSSIQGEGLFVGCRQVFIRFLGCNLACPYCDTPDSRNLSGECRVEKTPGCRDFARFANPLSPDELLDIISCYRLAKHHSVSITGGEPLLHGDFLSLLLPKIREKGPKVFLETNGTLPDELARVLRFIDIVSMDLKLTGNTPWEAHRLFLQRAAEKEVYAKIVILADTTREDLVKAAELVASVDSRIPLVLQPVTPHGQIRKTPGSETMIKLQDLALERLQDVRVIPQTHKIMGQL